MTRTGIRSALRLFSAILAMGAVLSTGPSCKKKPTDDDRLMKQIDTVKIHLYIGAKAALAHEGGGDLKAARELILKLVASGQGKDDRDLLPEKAPSAGDLAAMAKTVLTLRSTGKELLKSDRDREIGPVLPALTGNDQLYGKPSSQDRDMDRAAILIVLTALKFHPKTPVPVPPEIVLYEAWRTDPAALRAKGFAPPLHALKSFVYSMNELCDLASAESDAVFGALKKDEDFSVFLALLGKGAGGNDPEAKKLLNALFRSMTEGAVSFCYFKRDEQEKGKEHLSKMLDAVEAVGVVTPETEILRAYIECDDAKKEAALKGLTRMNALLDKSDLDRDNRAIAKDMVTFCETSSKTSIGFIRKIAFARMVFSISMRCSEKAGMDRVVEDSAPYRKYRGFLKAIDDLQENVPTADDVKKKAGGLFDRLKKP